MAGQEDREHTFQNLHIECASGGGEKSRPCFMISEWPAEQPKPAGEESKIMSVIDDGHVMLTAPQVREMTGVPVSTLHDWAVKRERGINAPGPHHLRLSDRHRRWLLGDVQQWLVSTRV
jgi:predicted DNA-binding transcriptional regulator AlpA